MATPPIPGETASNRMAQMQRQFRAQPARTRSLNEMNKGGKVALKKKAKSRVRK